MTLKTNFSFEVQYAAQSGIAQDERNAVMDSLGPSLQELFAAGDPSATVKVSDSHKGEGNKIIEVTTTLQDPEVAATLQAFSTQHGVAVSALE
jgi:hypothetical protein